MSHSLAQQTYEIIDTNKEIVPIYNFVRENEFPTRHNEELKDCYGILPEEKGTHSCIKLPKSKTY